MRGQIRATPGRRRGRRPGRPQGKCRILSRVTSRRPCGGPGAASPRPSSSRSGRPSSRSTTTTTAATTSRSRAARRNYFRTGSTENASEGPARRKKIAINFCVFLVVFHRKDARRRRPRRKFVLPRGDFDAEVLQTPDKARLAERPAVAGRAGKGHESHPSLVLNWRKSEGRVRPGRPSARAKEARVIAESEASESERRDECGSWTTRGGYFGSVWPFWSVSRPRHDQI